MKRVVYICMLALSALTLVIAHPSVTTAQAPVKIFALQRPDADPKPELPELKDPQVYGLSWRFKWATIEPEEGHYNWEVIDKAVEITSKAGKKAMLRVTAGINTPAWVYQAGAQPFEFPKTDLAHPENYPANLRMPLPWDEVYLTKWEGFINAFGKRYNAKPDIYSVQMTGGGHIGEMNLPKAHDKWRQIGYSDEKLINT
jgi:hypothetical protein